MPTEINVEIRKREINVNVVRQDINVDIGKAVSIGTAGKLEAAFDFNDFAAGEKLIGTMNNVKSIFRCVLKIDTTFDGGAGITVGDDGAQARLMTILENDPATAASYITEPDYQYTTATDLKLFLFGTPTQGSGSVTIYFN